MCERPRGTRPKRPWRERGGEGQTGAGADGRLVARSVAWSAGRVRLFTLQKAFECSANNIEQQQQKQQQQHRASTITTTITAAREQRTDWPCNTGRAARISCDLDEACLMLSTPLPANTQTTPYATPPLPSLPLSRPGNACHADAGVVNSIQLFCLFAQMSCNHSATCLPVACLFVCLFVGLLYSPLPSP